MLDEYARCGGGKEEGKVKEEVSTKSSSVTNVTPAPRSCVRGSRPKKLGRGGGTPHTYIKRHLGTWKKKGEEGVEMPAFIISAVKRRTEQTGRKRRGGGGCLTAPAPEGKKVTLKRSLGRGDRKYPGNEPSARDIGGKNTMMIRLMLGIPFLVFVPKRRCLLKGTRIGSAAKDMGAHNIILLFSGRRFPILGGMEDDDCTLSYLCMNMGLHAFELFDGGGASSDEGNGFIIAFLLSSRVREEGRGPDNKNQTGQSRQWENGRKRKRSRKTCQVEQGGGKGDRKGETKEA